MSVQLLLYDRVQLLLYDRVQLLLYDLQLSL